MTHKQKLKAFNRMLNDAIKHIKKAKKASFEVIAAKELHLAKQSIIDAELLWE